MPETTQPTPWPSPRGPWPDCRGIDQIYDPGAWWCITARGHPDHHGGYPDPDTHVPWHECHTHATSYPDARADLDGIPIQLEAYAAAPFRFGQPRTDSGNEAARIILEHYPDPTDTDSSALSSTRISLPPGQALLLARHLTRLVDRLTTPPTPAAPSGTW